MTRKMFTKEEIKLFAKLWETKTKEDIQDELKISMAQVTYLARQIRLAGFVLPFKKRKGTMENLIKDALKDSGLDFKK